ncbi:TIGR02679 domain-containing protein [Streptomyces tauricus]|uniref:TIGR02679 domain-containing protein n=1 Tax=Streptomyces tauricus TaxID=68274 RepID=UPI00387F329A
MKQWELSELAAHTTSDAHGLDEGRLTDILVLKAVAAALTLPSPDSAASCCGSRWASAQTAVGARHGVADPGPR